MKRSALFDKSFLGLTGSPIELRRVMNEYQVKAVWRDATKSGRYSIDHTAFTYVIDKQGRLRELLAYGAPVEDIAHDVRLLLRAPGKFSLVCTTMYHEEQVDIFVSDGPNPLHRLLGDLFRP